MRFLLAPGSPTLMHPGKLIHTEERQAGGREGKAAGTRGEGRTVTVINR